MKTFALRVIGVTYLLFCRLLMIPSLADADEPVRAETIEFLPAQTITLHEFEPDTLGPYEPRELGFYRRGGDKLYFMCDFAGSIIQKGSVENSYMFCDIRLNESIQSALHAAGSRSIPYGITLSGFGSYVLRQGVIYPMPYGELYRVEDLTRKDSKGDMLCFSESPVKKWGSMRLLIIPGNTSRFGGKRM